MPLSREIQDFVAQYGNKWNLEVNSACERFFDPLQAARPPHSDLKFEKSIQYGTHPRQRLDLYWKGATDETSETSTNLPVIVFFHGGGFRAGDNDISPHIHSNIAKYFASNSAICILATYRLLPDCQYPSGIEDITATLTWVKTHISSYGGSPSNVFVLGQSAGGAHVAMALFSGSLQKHSVIPRGVMLQSAPLWYDLEQERRRENMEAYYETKDRDQILTCSSLGLFKEFCRGGDNSSNFPDIFMTVGEFDAAEIVKGNLMFLEAYLGAMGRLPPFEVLKGHNHISYALSMGLEGDEVGPRILAWVRSLQG